MTSRERIALIKAAGAAGAIGSEKENGILRFAASLILEQVHDSQKQERKHIARYLESGKAANVEYAHELLEQLITEHDLELSYLEG